VSEVLARYVQDLETESCDKWLWYWDNGHFVIVQRDLRSLKFCEERTKATFRMVQI